ncbi:MAG: type VI secretion system tip protein TssI/VgrG [Acidobacteriota bacterium]|jgi:type VI secretion system secreted protein VgrG
MAEKYLEENRYLYLKSGLGPNELLLESFTGTEGISQLFSFQLELLSENQRIKFEDILGQEISFGVLGPEGSEPRHVHGIVTAFTQLPATPRLSRYRAIVSPKLWILTRKQDCRIFQKSSASDILKQVLQGIDISMELHEDHPVRDYCVQYRETDFNFVSRLMEEEGMFYFFRHTQDAHKLVIADELTAFQDMPGVSPLVYEEISGGLRDEARVSSWIKTQELGPGECSLQDYCFEIPATDISADMPIAPSTQVGSVTHKLIVGGNNQFDIYDYPGGYGIRSMGSGVSGARGIGETIARHHVERMEIAQFLIRGESNDFNLTPGYKFTLTRHPNADGAYVLTSITHSASEGGFHSGTEIGQNHYSNIFHSIPSKMKFRPPRTASKALVRGCQTAVVVGPAGEEIYPDKYGRIKVQFHWDRKGKKDDKSSCWIRVASFWAGHNWGAVHIPRIGQEVIVDFLEGDPDCPIVVGSVYNASEVPPWTLPDNKTQSGIKSQSSKGGGGSNEIRFEDKKGSEEIFTHAQKDMNTKVEHNETRMVGNDRTTTTGHDETRTIGHDRTTTIQHDETVQIANNRSTTVGVNETTSIGASMSLTVGQNRTSSVGSSDSETIGANKTVAIGASETHNTGAARATTIGSTDSLTAGGPINITAPMVTINASVITLNAAMVKVAGVVQCTTVIASASVVSPSYTPGAGNMM